MTLGIFPVLLLSRSTINYREPPHLTPLRRIGHDTVQIYDGDGEPVEMKIELDTP
jgi:hypothetical protein